MRAWWSGTLHALRSEAIDSIVGILATQLVQTHVVNHATQLSAWRAQLAILSEATRHLPADYILLLEYPLLRLGRRIDALLLTQAAILVLEFKIGSRPISAEDRRQVEDYALDLHDFHAGSTHHPIVPIVVTTDSRLDEADWPLCWHGVTPVFDANGASLGTLLEGALARLPRPRQPLDLSLWEAAPYRPVPNIVDAARLLYGRHGIEDIRAARADIGNLTRTTDVIMAAVQRAQRDGQHIVVFVTGIPGAGKTLCGLNTVFGTAAGAAFLTGNFPLIFVMRAALERDARAQGRSVRAARQETEAAIQPLMGFLRDNLERKEAPHEHVIVFDEAQRAWDAAFGARKFGHPHSEAAMFLDIMQRHPDWAVIVALVGNGQEINTGEAGLSAWGQALLERPRWRIEAAPATLTASAPTQRLFNVAPDQFARNDKLHLSVPVRSLKSTHGAAWVDAVLEHDANRADRISRDSGGIPFFLTRSLPAMRHHLRAIARGRRRAGLVCSAAARRLRAEGIDPNFDHMDDQVVANWFLGHWPDVRASDALEVAATQFACQGLELDYVGLCWGNDLVRRGGHSAWIPRKFIGTRWQELRGQTSIDFQINTYRVLLTRARYETVIWVPEGDMTDGTRPPSDFDGIAAFLIACGVALLVDHAGPIAPVATQDQLLC